jgi:hypothetical protein
MLHAQAAKLLELQSHFFTIDALLDLFIIFRRIGQHTFVPCVSGCNCFYIICAIIFIHKVITGLADHH